MHASVFANGRHNCFGLTTANGGAQNLEGANEVLIDDHHRSRIVELTAVVGCRKDGYKLKLAILNDVLVWKKRAFRLPKNS